MAESNFVVMMAFHTVKDGWSGSHHLPMFLVPACSPQEAIHKVGAMFPEGLRITGSVIRDEPDCDQFMAFDCEGRA